MAALVVPKPLVVAGPSGVGKGTLLNKLRQTFPDAFGYSVSYTSRKPRPEEIDGIHYHFISRERFLDDIKSNLFLEYATIYGNLYGTGLTEVKKIQERGAICLLEVDVQGVKQIKESVMGDETNYIFLQAPSMAELERRLKGRGTEMESKIKERLSVALLELEIMKSLNFNKIIINDQFEVAFQELYDQVLIWYPELIQFQNNK